MALLVEAESKLHNPLLAVVPRPLRIALVALQQRGEPRLIAHQQETRARMAFRRDLDAPDDAERRLIAAHGVHGQRVGRGQGRSEATPLPGLRREQRPSMRRPPGRPRAHHNSRNGCRRDAAA